MGSNAAFDHSSVVLKSFKSWQLRRLERKQIRQAFWRCLARTEVRPHHSAAAAQLKQPAARGEMLR